MAAGPDRPVTRLYPALRTAIAAGAPRSRPASTPGYSSIRRTAPLAAEVASIA